MPFATAATRPSTSRRIRRGVVAAVRAASPLSSRRGKRALGAVLAALVMSGWSGAWFGGSPASAQQSTFPEAPPDCTQLMGSIVVIDPPSPVHPTSFSVRYSLGTILRDDVKMSYTFTVTTPTGPFAVPPPAVRTQRGAAGDFEVPAEPGRFSFAIEVFSIGVGTGAFGAGAKCKTVHDILPTTTLPDLSGPTSKRATPATIAKVKVADTVRVQPQTIITTTTITSGTSTTSTTRPAITTTAAPTTSPTATTVPPATTTPTTATSTTVGTVTTTSAPAARSSTQAVTKATVKKVVKKVVKKRSPRTTRKRTRPSDTKASNSKSTTK